MLCALLCLRVFAHPVPLPGGLLFTYDSPSPTLGIPVESPTPSALGRASSSPCPVTSQPSIFIASVLVLSTGIRNCAIENAVLRPATASVGKLFKLSIHISGSGAWESRFSQACLILRSTILQ